MTAYFKFNNKNEYLIFKIVVTHGIIFSAHAQVRVQEVHQSEKQQEFINTRLKPTQTANFFGVCVGFISICVD